MCGIIGYVGPLSVGDVLIKGLKRLEYRGYDSAGVAMVDSRGVHLRKSEGKLSHVERMLETERFPEAHFGVGHTRWATHGKPTTQNAHPHKTGHVVIVHNGIVENNQEIRDEIVAAGHRPQSETDSELIGFLILMEMDRGASLEEAARRCFQKIEGSCSVVVFSEKQPGTMIGLRQGSPLVVAHGKNFGSVIASDSQAIIDYTSDVTFLETGDLVSASREGLRISRIDTGVSVTRPSVHIDWTVDKLDKQGYPHYMLKEIFEQPSAWVDTLNSTLDRKGLGPFPMADQPGVTMLRNAKRLVLVACGTSWHAALLGKYWIERWAGIGVDVELASEYRYRDKVFGPGTYVVAISQSGETADTLSVVREMRSRGIATLAITNVRGSTLARECDAVFFTSAGPEVGVAATKTFTAQMLTLFMWAGYLGLAHENPDLRVRVKTLFDGFLKVPHALDPFLKSDHVWPKEVRRVARKLHGSKGFFFIGRGTSFPIALEGALKLKEIAYVHAEGYAGGELKHGPIAMLDPSMTVVVLCPRDRWREKTLSNLQEVKARGARVMSVGFSSDSELRALSDEFLALPGVDLVTTAGGVADGFDESLYPFFLAPVVQLLAYELAVLSGTDVDQPRNLAKSVTVE